jgi:hypothetical protein
LSDQPSPFDFEKYQPRESTPIPTSRRGLLRAVISEIHAYSGKVDGKLTLKLADLALLPNEELESIRPVRMDGCRINLRENMVWAQAVGQIEPAALFPVDSPALKAFNLFDGRHSLADIGLALAGETGWPDEKARAYTRGLFLKLVSLHVCVPK